MPATLIKETNYTYTPARAGTPGSPGQPYIAPRPYVESYQVCSYYAFSPLEIIAAYAAQGIQVSWGIVGTDSQGNAVYGYTQSGSNAVVSSIQTSGYRCRTETRMVVDPGQPYIPPTPPSPATPEQITYDYQIGWNSRANSIPRMIADGRYSFRVPVGVSGAVVGLTRNPQRSGYSDMLWAFYVSKGVVRIYERGVEVSNLGSAPNADLSIERRKGRILYKMNGATVRDTSNDSGPMMLSAALYSGGDSVQNASYEDLNTGTASVSFQPLQAFGNAAGVKYAVGAGSFQPLTLSAFADAGGSANLSFKPLQAFASDASGYAIGSLTLSALTGGGEGLAPPPPYALGGGNLSSFTLLGIGYSGTIGGGGGSLRSLTGIGSQGDYAQGGGSLRALTASGFNFSAPDEVVMSNLMVSLSDYTGQADVFVVMNSAMQIEGIFTVQTLRDAELLEELSIEQEMITQQELMALLMSVMSARGVAADEALGYTVWALNTQLMGSTRYENYAFNAMARIGQTYYGTNSSGLYRLEGSSDDGTDIEASINLGNQNFGDLTRKALPYCYMGVASNGRLVLKVEADGHTYYYTVRDRDELLKAQRFELGRGLRASFYDLTIMNSGGSHFELSDIEFTPIKLNRRL